MDTRLLGVPFNDLAIEVCKLGDYELASVVLCFDKLKLWFPEILAKDFLCMVSHNKNEALNIIFNKLAQDKDNQALTRIVKLFLDTSIACEIFNKHHVKFLIKLENSELTEKLLALVRDKKLSIDWDRALMAAFETGNLEIIRLFHDLCKSNRNPFKIGEVVNKAHDYICWRISYTSDLLTKILTHKIVIDQQCQQWAWPFTNCLTFELDCSNPIDLDVDNHLPLTLWLHYFGEELITNNDFEDFCSDDYYKQLYIDRVNRAWSKRYSMVVLRLKNFKPTKPLLKFIEKLPYNFKVVLRGAARATLNVFSFPIKVAILEGHENKVENESCKPSIKEFTRELMDIRPELVGSHPNYLDKVKFCRLLNNNWFPDCVVMDHVEHTASRKFLPLCENLGDCFFYFCQNIDLAKQAYKKALSVMYLYPCSPEDYREYAACLARLYCKLGMILKCKPLVEKAEIWLERAQVEGNSDLNVLFADLCFKSGEYGRTLKYLCKVISVGGPSLVYKSELLYFRVVKVYVEFAKQTPNKTEAKTQCEFLEKLLKKKDSCSIEESALLCVLQARISAPAEAATKYACAIYLYDLFYGGPSAAVLHIYKEIGLDSFEYKFELDNCF